GQAGGWSYTVDDANAGVQALNVGGTLVDQDRESAAEGTTQQIDVTIHGQNDAAVITGDTTGSVTEAGGVTNGTPGTATATGTLHATDVDSAATFVAQSDVVEAHGRFSIGTAGGWSYTVDDANAAVQALNVGGTLVD